MKAQVKKAQDFKPQPLKGIYANSEELGIDVNRFFMETLMEATYKQLRNKQEQ